MNFSTGIDLRNHHRNQDAGQYQNYKKFPRALLYNDTLSPPQPLISHHSLPPLLYSSHMELISIPPNTPFLDLMVFAHAVPSASNSLPFDQCLFNLQD